MNNDRDDYQSPTSPTGNGNGTELGNRSVRSGFLFDPELDNRDLDILFEFVVSGTWQKAFEVLDEYRNRTHTVDFWKAVSEHLERCGDDSLREHIVQHSIIGVHYLSDGLSSEQQAHHQRYPKPRPRGDSKEAQMIYARREAARASGDRVLEHRIVREVLSIDPCATTVWISCAYFANEVGDQKVLERCLKRYAECLTAEFDLGLFAFNHGVQAVARGYLEQCLNSLMGNEAQFPSIAVSVLSILGHIYSEMDMLEQALTHAERACEIAEFAFSEYLAGLPASQTSGEYGDRPFSDSDLVRFRMNVAYAMMRVGKFEEAKSKFELVLNQLPARDDESDTTRSRALIGLGETARRRGDDDRAIVLIIQGIECLGLRVESDGRLRNNKGEPWRPDIGIPFADVTTENYPDPNPKSFDPNHTWFADSYEKLTLLLGRVKPSKQPIAAEFDAKLLRVAMAPFHSTMRGKALSILGTHLWRNADYDRAEEALRAALEEYEDTERGWSAIADSEQILAEVFLAKGQPAEALVSIDAAIEHFPTSHDLPAGKQAPNLAQCHMLRARILAQLAGSSDQPDRAAILIEARKAASYLKSMPADDTELRVDATNENVGILLFALGQFEEAAELLVRSARGNVSLYPKYVDVTTSPSEALDRTGSPFSLWLLLQLMMKHETIRASFLPPVLGLLLNSRRLPMMAFQNAMRDRAASGDEARRLYGFLQQLRGQIQASRLSGQQQSKQLEELTYRERAAMSQLHELTSRYRQPHSYDNDDPLLLLRDSLMPNEAHVEFVTYQPLAIELGKDFSVGTQPDRAAAIVCSRVGDGLSIALYDLGDESALSALGAFINRPYLFKKGESSSADLAVSEAIGRLYPFETDEGLVDLLRTKYRIDFDRTFEPVMRAISGFQRWRFALRGSVTQLCLDFLPVDGKLAIDNHEIILDSIPARWRETSSRSRHRRVDPLVIGAPEFSALDDSGGSTRTGQMRHAFSWPFEPLPGAHAEAKEIAELMGTRAVLGAEATRDCLLKADSPPIIHVATHGFYLKPEQRAEAAEAIRASCDPAHLSNGGVLARLTHDDPHFHIGLALAGADSWFGSLDLNDFNRGLVFGDEISLMSLVWTDLVVLSCCDSGLGLVHNIHGAINLPRAFLSAGAKAVVASLWPLSDELVRPIMVSFYQYVLAGETVITALTRAKRDAIAHGAPKLVWGALQLYGSGDHIVRLSA